MNKVLNIVNGDAVIKTMKEAKIPGSFLPWRDFLHEGPVPENLSLEALSKIRAQYIASQGYESYANVHRQFQERNSTLHAFRRYDRVVLWFEHDLYDQLQLIQILDWFAKYSSDISSIFLVCPDKHLGVCSPEKLKELLLYNKEPLTHNQLVVARKAWSAFTSPSPAAWAKLLEDDTSSLPFLRGAVLRMLEEYPNTINGLSKTAHIALLTIVNGTHKPYEIFEAYQQREERRFMGDVIFFNLLKRLVDQDVLTVSEEGKHFEITPIGRSLLKGERNWLNLIRIDFWLGGVHLTQDTIWRWDIREQKILPNPKNLPIDAL